MDVVYRLEGFEFEWNGGKAQSNFVKHGAAKLAGIYNKMPANHFDD